MQTILAFDAGGTWSRARVVRLDGGGRSSHPAPSQDVGERLSTADAFLDFVEETAAALADPVDAAVVAVAGPVEEGVRAAVGNWREPRILDLADLEARGLPAGRTTIVNDLVAGMIGVLCRLERDGIGGPSFEALYEPGEAVSPWRGNLVYVAPGTGLGASAAIKTAGGGADAYVPVGSECQHTTMPVFAEDVAAVAERMTGTLGHTPTWEEFASARGLADAYTTLCEIEGREPMPLPESDEARAEAVSGAAATGADRAARRALDLYYRAVARFTQLLALAHFPCAGVFLGGATTARNRERIAGGPYAAEFRDNGRLAGVLGSVPVHLVLEEVNLEGALRHGAKLLP